MKSTVSPILYPVKIWLTLCLCVAAVFLLATQSPVSNSNSDPELTLVVAQALVEYGTIRLDAYEGRLALSRDFAAYRASNNILQQNDHFYNYFPVGASLLATPAVALAISLGHDMTTFADNDALQNLLSGMTVALVFVLLFVLAHCYLDAAASLILALIFTLGTGLMSTLGTAYWTHNLSIPLFLMVLWLLARCETGQAAIVHPFLVGLLLFLAYLCRASAAAFILPLFLYLLGHVVAALKREPASNTVWRQLWHSDLFRVAFSAGLLLGFYLLWSRFEYGQWLPDYYSVDRFTPQRAAPLTAIAGLLLSPGRGLFIYSAFLLPIGGMVIWSGRVIARQGLFWLCLAWLALHFVIIVRASSWWGGASFGPRLLVDVMPALFWLTVQAWREVGSRPRRFILLLATPLVLWSVYLNSYQGLFNRYLGQWETELGNQPGGVGFFDWRYPPFAASPELFCERDQALLQAWFAEPVIAQAIGFGAEVGASQGRTTISSDTPLNPYSAVSLPRQVYLPLIQQPAFILISGWSPTVDGYRWSKCPQAVIYVPLGEVEPERDYQLVVRGATNGPQTITLQVNEQALDTFVWDVPVTQPEIRVWLIPGAVLRSGAQNEIQFDLPDARPPNGLDTRLLALAFFSIRIEEVVESRPQLLPYP